MVTSLHLFTFTTGRKRMQTSAIIHNCEYIKRELQYRSGAIKLKADLLKKFCRSGPKSRLSILNTSMDQSVKEFNIILLKGHITKQDFFCLYGVLFENTKQPLFKQYSLFILTYAYVNNVSIVTEYFTDLIVHEHNYRIHARALTNMISHAGGAVGESFLRE